jgi:hypothetical protein
LEGARNAYNILVGKIEGRRPIERDRRRWEDNIKKGSYFIRIITQMFFF